MPRAARKKSESNIYHAMLRGIDRQVIFQDDEDCETYLHCLEAGKALSGFTLHAYCLLGNHLHLLIQEGEEPLEQIFKRIGVRYVYWYNRKYARTGHLFQDRFKSEPVSDDAYFLAVLRYIYQNPVKAGLCNKPEDYPWSSCRLLGKQSALVTHAKALELLPEAELQTFFNEFDQETYLEAENTRRLTDREAIHLIKGICALTVTTEFVHLTPELQADYLRQLHAARCSIRQLSRLVGLSKAQVERMLR